MKRRILLEEITTLLDNLSSKIAYLPASTGDTSNNNYGEIVGIKLLNKIYGYNLEDANSAKVNAIAIDAFDIENHLYIQITSNFTSAKIKNTVEKFVTTEYYKKDAEPSLKFLILNFDRHLNKINNLNNILSGLSEENEKLHIDKHSIINFNTILRKIRALPIGKVESVHKLLQKECGHNQNESNTNRKYIALACSNEYDDGLEITKKIVESLVLLGYDVLLSCENLYSELKNSRNLKNRIWHVTEKDELEDSIIAIIKTEDGYRLANSKDNVKCPILKYIVEEGDLKYMSIYTDRNITTPDFPLDSIGGEKITNENFSKSWDRILSRITRNLVGIEYNIDDILSLLLKIHPYEYRYIEKDAESGYYLIDIYNKSRTMFYYLAVLGNKDIKKIARKFNRNHANIDKEKLEIIIQKDIFKKGYISEVKRLFGCEAVQYIGDWYHERFLSGKRIPQYDFDLSNFIDPKITSGNADYNSTDLLCWINDPSSDIAIIVGSGGIGKTTLCSHLYFELNKNLQNAIIFIKSEDILEYFQKRELQYDLYEIYKKWNEKKFESPFSLDREVFQTLLRTGNLIIFFDGLDEVISTCKEFSIDQFFINLSKFLGSRQKSKIIISLRDAYISDINLLLIEDTKAKIFEVKDFDSIRMEQYFKVRFSNENAAIERAIKLAKKISQRNIISDDLKTKFPPYFLKIIGDMVEPGNNENEDNFQNVDRYDFNETYFDKSKLEDILINGILQREEHKKRRTDVVLGNSVENQIKLLVRMALSGNLFAYKNILMLCNGIDTIIDKEKAAKRIMDHPLLKKTTDGECKFKYDFLEKYFIALGLLKALLNKEKFDSDLRFNLAMEINQNSIVYNILKDRLSKIEYKSIIIETIKSFVEPPEANAKIDGDAISSLFIFLLSFGNNSPKSNTNFLKEVFEVDTNKIDNFYLISPNHTSLIFDFSNIEFFNSVIDDYSNFFRCTFNENTFFSSSCTIKNLRHKTLVKNNAPPNKNNFDQYLKGDDSLIEYLQMGNNFDEIQRIEVLKDTMVFFNIIKAFNGEKANVKDWNNIERYYRRNSTISIPFEQMKDLYKSEKIFADHADKGISIDNTVNKEILNYQNNGDVIPKSILSIVDKIMN